MSAAQHKEPAGPPLPQASDELPVRTIDTEGGRVHTRAGGPIVVSALSWMSSSTY